MTTKSFFLTLVFLVPFLCNGTELIHYPKDKQLYTRDHTDSARVEIKLKNIKNTLQEYSIVAMANGLVISQQTNTLQVNEFWDWSILIKASFINYSFFIYEKTGSNTALVQKAENVVCGDVFVIYGQSNGNAFSGVDDYIASNYNDQWIRTTDYNATNSLQWYRGLERKFLIGSLGMWLAKLSSQGQNVPIALINGSEGGKTIIALGERNNANPMDKSTFYGKLLSRVLETGSIQKIKGLVWFQGEAETSGDLDSKVQYLGRLETLYANMVLDYPPIERFVVMQINLLNSGFGEAGIIRNYQANFRLNDPKVVRLATVGQTFAYDGVHYGRQGYERLSEMIYDYFSNNVYSLLPLSSFNSPRIQAAVKDLEMNRLRLIFEEGQIVNLPGFIDRHYGRREINPFIFINGQNNQIRGIESVGNEIRLDIFNLSQADKITYLPSFFSDANTPGYDGPVIKNAGGFSALTFYDYKIKDNLPVFNYDEVFYRERKLFFKLTPGLTGSCVDCVLKVERKRAENSTFEKRMDVPISSTVLVLDTFDSNETSTQTWNYRVQMEGQSAISPKLNFDLKVCSDLNISQSLSYDGTLRGKKIEGDSILDEAIIQVFFDKSTILLPGFQTQAGRTVSILQKSCENQ